MNAWPLEQRRAMMRDVVATLAAKGKLDLKNAAHIARSYGPNGQILPCEVEAEMLKYQSEGCDK